MLASLLTQAAYAQLFDVAENGLPILNSNPGALSVAYIDFDGGPALGGTERAPFGGDLVFDTTEQSQIYNAWLDISTHFAMFDINVTTVAPNKFVNPTSHVIVTPDVSGAAANTNFHGSTSTSARGQAGSGNALSRTTGITHEFGHILGLNHQSLFDEDGVRIKAYRGVDEWNRAPIMGVDYAGGHYAHWADGTGSGGQFQDDVTIIINSLVRENNEFSGNTYTGDGFRLDEHGNSALSATPLLVEQVGVAGHELLVSADARGIIERYTDTDMFSLDWTGGMLSISAEAVRSVASAQDFASSVGLNLHVYDHAGSEIAQDLAVDPADVHVALDLNLSAGTYYFGFEGGGGIGDLGAYNIALTGTTPDPAVTRPGDTDGDGDVDAADWAVFIANAQSDMTGLSAEQALVLGDLDGDFDNDLSDFILFRSAFEQDNPAPGAFAAMLTESSVPEPTSLALLGIAGLLIAGRQRSYR